MSTTPHPNYTLRVCWSDEDECLVAQCVDLPSIMAHGDTAPQAIQSLLDALDGAAEVMAESGVQLPQATRPDWI